ncbi:MAG: PH domain-containing protein [Patescibacteria group bacterium]
MFSESFSENSQIIRVVHRKFLVYSPSVLASIILVLGAFFFMLPLFGWSPFGWDWAGEIVFGFLIGLGVLYGLMTFLVWWDNRLIISNDGLIIYRRKGFFDQHIFKFDYQKIRNIDLSIKGFFQTIFRFGSLTINFNDTSASIFFSHVSRPLEIQALILKIQVKAQKEKEDLVIDDLSEIELIELARKIRDKLGRDIFNDIANE